MSSILNALRKAGEQRRDAQESTVFFLGNAVNEGRAVRASPARKPSAVSIELTTLIAGGVVLGVILVALVLVTTVVRRPMGSGAAVVSQSRAFPSGSGQEARRGAASESAPTTATQPLPAPTQQDSAVPRSPVAQVAQARPPSQPPPPMVPNEQSFPRSASATPTSVSRASSDISPDPGASLSGASREPVQRRAARPVREPMSGAVAEQVRQRPSRTTPTSPAGAIRSVSAAAPEPEQPPLPEVFPDIPAGAAPGVRGSVANLPELSDAERMRLGLPLLKVNFVTTSGRNRSQPSALINYQKVFVGETIPGTRAILVGVDPRGIGIEVDGKRYFVR